MDDIDIKLTFQPSNISWKYNFLFTQSNVQQYIMM